MLVLQQIENAVASQQAKNVCVAGMLVVLWDVHKPRLASRLWDLHKSRMVALLCDLHRSQVGVDGTP